MSIVLGARTVGSRSASGCRPLSVPSPPMAISPSMPSLVRRSVMQVELRLLVRVDVVARRADERAALGRIELGDLLEQRIQVHVRHARVEEAVEALDEPVDFNPELVGAHDGAVYGGVERRRVTSGRQNADAFHGWLLETTRSPPRSQSTQSHATEYDYLRHVRGVRLQADQQVRLKPDPTYRPKPDPTYYG